MPRISEEFGKATRFPEKTRERVISQWLAGIADRTIAKDFRGLEVQDVKDIVQLYKDQFPDEFEDLRKKRQIEFINKAWEIITLSQKRTIEFLKLKTGKSVPHTYINLMAIMVDKLKVMEGRESHGEDKPAFKLSKDEGEELKKAKERIDQTFKNKNEEIENEENKEKGNEEENKSILVEANKIVDKSHG